MKTAKNQAKPTEELLNLDFVNPQYPVDSTAERALVASLLDSPHRLPEAVLQLGGPAAMGNDAYRLLLETMMSLQGENKPIKLSSILQTLNQSGKTKTLIERGVSLIDLQREATSSDLLQTCIYLRGLFVKRLAVDASNQIRACVAANESVDTISAKAAALYEAITTGLSVGVDKRHSDYVSEALNRLDKAMQNPGKMTGVDTGLAKLNKHLGGWQDSDVIMIAGRPGMGKSVQGVFHAYSAAKAGVPVAFLSLEMPAYALINRMIALITGIPYSDISKGYITPEQAAQIHKAAGEVERLPIHWYDEAERDVADLSYLLINWKRKYNIGLVLIDYVQLMEDRTVRTTDEYQVLTSVSKKVKKLQRALGCPLIELAQLNRGVESRTSRRGKPSDLKATGQFEQDASLIIMLYRADAYAEEDAIEQAKETGRYVKPERDHKLENGIVKNRDGYTGTILLHCEVDTNRMYSEPPATVAERVTLSNYPATAMDSWYQPLTEDKF